MKLRTESKFVIKFKIQWMNVYIRVSYPTIQIHRCTPILCTSIHTPCSIDLATIIPTVSPKSRFNECTPSYLTDHSLFVFSRQSEVRLIMCRRWHLLLRRCSVWGTRRDFFMGDIEIKRDGKGWVGRHTPHLQVSAGQEQSLDEQSEHPPMLKVSSLICWGSGSGLFVWRKCRSVLE